MSNRQGLLDRLPKRSIGVEIGVAKGNFSAQILENVNPKRLYLVDPWHYDKKVQAFNRFYGGRVGSQKSMDKMYEEVYNRFCGDRRVEIRRKRSDEFLVETTPDYFDWVYVDGDHDFGPVALDILLSVPTVKVGGFICGDDYRWGKEYGFPVEKAVEMITQNDRRLERVAIDGRLVNSGQWMFRRVR